MIGNVRCYWYGKDGCPRITIGPTWMFAVPVFIGALIIAYCFINGLLAMSNLHPGLLAIAWTCLVVNSITYLYTLFANQGIPKEIFVKQLLVGGGASGGLNESIDHGDDSNKSESFKNVTLESDNESSPKK